MTDFTIPPDTVEENKKCRFQMHGGTRITTLLLQDNSMVSGADGPLV